MGTASRFFSAFSACIAVGLAALVALMSAAGELYTTREAVRAQLAAGGIYGRVIWDDFFAYKMAMFESRPTSAVSVGSSRAMAMRAGLFRDGGHFSLGGAVQSIEQFENTVAALVDAPRPPKLALVFVDFEWFVLPPRRSQNDVARETFDSPVYLLQSGFAKLRDLLRAASAKRLPADPVGGGPLFGGRARVWGDGFRVDGSIQNYSYESGLQPFPEADMAAILDAEPIARARDVERFIDQRKWRHGQIQAGRMQRFGAAISRMEAADISPILVLAPIAPHLADALEVHPGLRFFPAWRAQMVAIAAAHGWPLHDFTHAELRHPDCWVDRYHASEGAYAWMLARMRDGGGRSRMLLDAHSDKDAVERFGSRTCARVLRF